MKLYYSPGACSLSPHIVANEAGLELQLQKVDTKTHTLQGGGDFYAINSKGYVPTLQLDNGEFLTEGPAIVQYLADQKPSSKLAPANGTLERYRLQEMLGFINSEIHKSYGPLFNSKTLPVKVDLSEFPNLVAFQKRIAARPAVQKAMKEEGLLK
jgi:glutathione S-transferase